VGAAAREDAVVVLHRAGEGPLAVAKELRLDERLGVLAQVDGHKGLGEAHREALPVLVPGDVARAPDGDGGRPLAGAGLPQEDGGEVLHAIPQELVVAAQIAGEDVVPEGLAQALHRRALPRSPSAMKK
jgi:hypothetical protein